MRISSWLVGLALGATLSLGAGSVRAQDSEYAQYPFIYSERPMTLRALTLEPIIGLDATRFVTDPSAVTRDLTTNLTLAAGVRFGILSSLEVAASLASIQVAPKVAYGNPDVSITFRPLATVVELGLRLQTTVVTSDKIGVLGDERTGAIIVRPSIPILIHFGKTGRLDLAPGGRFSIQTSHPPSVTNQPNLIGVDIPAALATNIFDSVHIGAQSSVFIPDINNVSKSLTVPLGLFAGFSIGSERPIVELDPYFTWPQFATPGATGASAKQINTDVFTAGLSVSGFFYL